ncbi:hypothetical protein C942_04085 [Photobacterium marinum]|uniref:Uncharacterized protein n=1 Tax=Photobacterium marinum TaxID=1056511 RepID=L8J4K2_9GAMM|nr:hypothetical protein C942_04085 [Photobacterium marinum]
MSLLCGNVYAHNQSFNGFSAGFTVSYNSFHYRDNKFAFS